MKNVKHLVVVLVLLITYSQTLVGYEAGDRRLPIEIKFPPQAYFHNGQGGNVIDITQPPFNAVGDGVHNDTEAFVRAYDFILTEQDKVGYSATAMLNTSVIHPNTEGYPIDEPLINEDASYIIYLPEGEYLVSDTLIYSMEDRTPKNRQGMFYRQGELKKMFSGWERFIWLRLIGESREKTVIRLVDNAVGFGVGEEKAVLAFGKSPFNNRKALSSVCHLTVNTGKGNPGAVAIDFTGANKAEMTDLTLTSDDGLGQTGILFKRPPVIGYHHDITIRGFNYGIVSRVGHASAPVFEYITLENINDVGVLLAAKKPEEGGHGEAFLCLRKIKSSGQSVFAEVTEAGAHLVVLDSLVTATGKSGGVAVKRSAGELFIRNLSAIGFESALWSYGEPLDYKEHVDEYVYGQALGRQFDGETVTSLNMAHNEAPLLDYPKGVDDWVTPEQFGAKADGEHDDTEAIQAAFDSGKSVVFFTNDSYRVTDWIRVPSTVSLVNGLYRLNKDLKFIVNQAGEEPVVFYQFYRGVIQQASARSVVRKMAEMDYLNTAEASGGTFYCLGGSYPAHSKNKGRVNFYGWSVNNEGKGLPVVADGSDVWMLGLKTERGPAVYAYNGAQVEILGATLGVRTGDLSTPSIINHESRLCIVANKSAGPWDLEQTVIESVIGGETALVLAKDLPARGTGKKGYCMIPLYSESSKNRDRLIDRVVLKKKK